MQTQAEYRAKILDAADYVQRDGIKAWDVIEPLAGFFAPRVQAEVQTELRLRGLDPWTGLPAPPVPDDQKEKP